MSDFLHNAWALAVEYWQTIVGYIFLLSTIFAAFVMSVFRTAQKNGKIDWLESGMCGVFAWGTWFVLGFFNLPDGAGVLVGGIIGYKGTHYFSEWLSAKLGMKNDSTK